MIFENRELPVNLHYADAENLKLRCPKTASICRYLPERTTPAKILKFGWYFTWKGIYKGTKLALGNKNFDFRRNFKPK